MKMKIDNYFPGRCICKHCINRKGGKKAMRANAKGNCKLYVCASCEWIYEGDTPCPKCGFAYYTAYSVYGKKAYRYKKTQEPWLNKKLAQYRSKLRLEIER